MKCFKVFSDIIIIRIIVRSLEIEIRLTVADVSMSATLSLPKCVRSDPLLTLLAVSLLSLRSSVLHPCFPA